MADGHGRAVATARRRGLTPTERRRRGATGTIAAMRLIPWEEDRLLIFGAAELARRHRAAGNRDSTRPEAIALMRATRCSRRPGRPPATRRRKPPALPPCLPARLAGVRELVEDVRVEVLLRDGVRLIVLVDPLGRVRATRPWDRARW